MGDSGGDGLYGAFGYDLVFQFEPIELRHSRDMAPPDLHLYLPDDLVIIDHRKEQAYRLFYDFEKVAFAKDFTWIESCLRW